MSLFFFHLIKFLNIKVMSEVTAADTKL